MNWKRLYQVAFTLLCLSIGVENKEDELIIKSEYIPDDCQYEVKSGDKISVHYTGKLKSGAVFDSSRQAGREPIAFTLGARQVIPGWEQGLMGMCVGEKRQLSIPPHLAYGKNGHPPVIPANSWLYFETELMSYESAPAEPIDVEYILQVAKFWAIPLVILYAVYKLWKRYEEDTSKSKTSSKAKKAKRR